MNEVVNNTLSLMSSNSEVVIGLVVIAVFLAFLIDRIQNKKSKDSGTGTGGGSGGGDNPPTQKK